MQQIAIKFGESLDADDFKTTKSLLSENCEYVIGEDTLFGPDAITRSYEDNMIKGRKKLDKLEWGKSTVEEIGDNEYFVHFTDYLTHKGHSHIHRCRQKLFLEGDKISRIVHVEDPEQKELLKGFYKKVGLL